MICPKCYSYDIWEHYDELGIFYRCFHCGHEGDKADFERVAS